MITLTEKAAMKVKVQLMNRDRGHGIRIGVRTTGCSGFTYGFTFDEDQNEDDFLIEKGTVRVLIDEMSYQYLVGATIDYIEDIRGSQFSITNPNATSTCGCGSSFSV